MFLKLNSALIDKQQKVGKTTVSPTTKHVHQQFTLIYKIMYKLKIHRYNCVISAAKD